MTIAAPINTLFRQKRPVFWLLALALLLMLPSLWAGLFADDFSHALLLQGETRISQPQNLSLWQLFTFVNGDAQRNAELMQYSLAPWWLKPDFTMVFWRPLAELSHGFDYALWPQSPWLMHAHSLLWFLAFLAVVQVALRPMLPKPVFLWALLLLAVDASHGFTVSWLANRNALMAGVFAFAALAFYQKLLQRPSVIYLLLLNASVALAFASAEMGITAGVLLFAYSLFYGGQELLKKWLWLLPSLALFLAWLWVYKAYGYGASGNQFYYADMLGEPGFFLLNLASRLPVALSMLFSIVPWHYLPNSQWLSVATGAAVLFVLLGYVWQRQKPYLYFALLALMLAIVPISSAEIQERNLLMASVASAIILADVLVWLLVHGKALWQRALLLVLIVSHVYLSAIIALPMAFAPKILAAASVNAAKQLPVSDNPIISFGLPLFSMAFVSQIRLYQEQPLPQAFINASTVVPQQVEFLGENTWRVSHAESLLQGEDYLLRDFASTPIAEGQSISLPYLSITVETVNKHNEPTQLLLKGRKDVQYQLLTWHNNKARYQLLKPRTQGVNNE